MHKFFIILGILMIICAVVLSQCAPKDGLNLDKIHELILTGPK